MMFPPQYIQNIRKTSECDADQLNNSTKAKSQMGVCLE